MTLAHKLYVIRYEVVIDDGKPILGLLQMVLFHLMIALQSLWLMTISLYALTDNGLIRVEGYIERGYYELMLWLSEDIILPSWLQVSV